MRIKDYTNRNKFISFFTMYSAMFLGILMHRLIQADYAYALMKIELTDFIVPLFVGFVSATKMNKVKIVISQIKDLAKLKEWINSYFIAQGGDVLHSSSQYILFEKVELVKRIFRKTVKTYYEVSIKEDRAEITGPFYRKPKIRK